MDFEFLTASDAWFARLLLERGLAALYLIAFLAALNQFPALLGERGLLPAPEFLRRHRFRECPSLFHWHYSDRLFRVVAWTGMALSAILLLGLPAAAPLGVPLVVWLMLWFLYQSIVNIGRIFYSFGWESMLLEAGFFAAFLGPHGMAPSVIPLWVLRWMLFRVEIGAGLIKLRAGGCWLDRTALDYHHETQPLPNPLSRSVHHLPRWMLHGGVTFSHLVQVVVPFGLFLPQPVAGTAAALIVFHQLLLIVAGNYAWLNWLTIVLAFAALPDAWLAPLFPPPHGVPLPVVARPMLLDVALLALAGWTLFLSVAPARNLCSKHQRMNYCWNRWHLVNAYGAFGTVTTERYEIVVEGTADDDPSDSSEWLPYEFRGKPGNLARIPPVVAPYHLRLDWLMWFLPFSVSVTPHGILCSGPKAWFVRFVDKLLEGDRATIRLLKRCPFPEQPPRYIRARYFLYQFTTRAERREGGHVWKRKYIDDYLPPTRLEGARRN